MSTFCVAKAALQNINIKFGVFIPDLLYTTLQFF